MDLTVSPDLDAYLCYATVLFFGAVTAIQQIFKRLGNIQYIWLVPQTWVLFFLYIIVPLILFWLLDRTGAINDTSFFAAVLVGISYERIITGGSQTLRAPGEVSQIWTPFVAYADRVSQIVLKKTEEKGRAVAEQIVTSILENEDNYKTLQDLAMRVSADGPALEKELDEIDQLPGALGSAGKLEKKVRLLYGKVLLVPDAFYLMRSKKIIDTHTYWFTVKRLSSALKFIFAGSIVISIAIFSFWSLSGNSRDRFVQYYVWRTVKSNTSPIDQQRARRNLLGLMTESEVRKSVTEQLTDALREPKLDIDRADAILQTLLEGRAKGRDDILSMSLIQSLRSKSVDVRTRVNDILKFLSEACVKKSDDGLASWKPNEGDSISALEKKIAEWKDYWLSQCLPK